MKRTQLKRKSQLRAKPFDPKTGELRFSTFAAKATGLARSSLKRTPPKTRSMAEGGDEAYLDFVRGLPCCVYGDNAPSHAHHETGNGRGKGQKGHDHRTMPLSSRAHREFHDGKGFCKGWPREERLTWQSAEIDRVRSIWTEWRETGVFVEPARKAI